jgi:hypothetical protein
VRLAADRAAAIAGVRPDFIADRGLSDHSTFLAEKIDVIALSTGDDFDYHTTTDLPSRLNLRGVERVIDFAESIIRQRDALARPPRG